MSERYEQYRETLAQIEAIVFGHSGEESLPVRFDALDDASDFAWGFMQGVRFAGLPAPAGALNNDGTIALTYQHPGEIRTLVITFCCTGIVTYCKLFEDGETTISGIVRFSRLHEDYPGDEIPVTPELVPELASLLDWILEE